MIDDEVKKYSDLFNKYGDPSSFMEKLGLGNVPVLNTFYDAYEIGLLREVVAVSGIIPTVKAYYKKDRQVRN